MSTVPPGLFSIRTPFVNCHVLVDEARRAVVIDTGFIGSRRKLERLISRLGLPPASVQAIVLTDGHIDHAGNVAWLMEWTGAPVWAHPAEQAHIDGVYPYRGVARVCGILEAIGRGVTGCRPVCIDEFLVDGATLPLWGGLRVVHLPGHTLGHCCLWSERLRLLFAGDLVAIWTWRTTYPPPIYNSAPELLPASLRSAAALKPWLVVPNHYNTFDPAWVAGEFARFAARKLREQTQRAADVL